MDVWAGDIELPGGGAIQSIELVATRASAPSLDRISLRFLAVVDVARIPLYLATGPPLNVYSQSDATQDWFSALLLGGHATEKDAEPWWQQQSSTTESPIGILTEVRRETNNVPGPAVTEILFYAAAAPEAPADPTSSPAASPVALTIHALPLSSDLLGKPPAVTTTTPPLSPGRPPAPSDDDDPTITAEFLPPLFPDHNDATSSTHTVTANTTTTTRKRQSVSSLFDEATERRKRARRKGGESIAAAAAAGAAKPVPPPPIQHRRSTSDVFDPPGKGSVEDVKAGRTLSRSPSLSLSGEAAVGGSSRKAALAEVGGGKRSSSGLSRVTSVVDGDVGEGEGRQQQQQTVETRNKDVISRLVMAGMRMYGLQQRKRTARKGSTAGTEEGLTAEDAAKDEEYKLVYHQAYRGTVFAMRNYIAVEPLTFHMEQLRETVDKLLAIFCTDPLAAPLPVEHSSAAVTPAAKQPFGTPTAGTEGSPFGQRGDYFESALGLRGGKVHTPVIRRQAG